MRFLGSLRLLIVLGVLVAAAVGLFLLRPWKGQSRLPARSDPPLAMFQDYTSLVSYPAGTLQILRSLGVGAVRVLVPWALVAADATSRTQPAGDPYPAASWAAYDAIDRDAQKDGIQLDLLLTGSAPLWATATGEPRRDPTSGVWYPSAAAYGQFVAAAGNRYSGHYTPRGATAPLPAVHFWEIWDEPNWGPSLQPQLVLNPLRIASAPLYRQLLDASWNALQHTGHGSDTIVIGNLSPRGTTTGTPTGVLPAAAYFTASPLGFTRALYCVDGSYNPLRGSAAAEEGCPTSAAGSRQFRQQHPALFHGPGFGIHPYPVNLPPTEADTTNPDTVEFSQIPHLTNALDRIQHAYGSSTKLGVYITEYGYITHPPNVGTAFLSPERAGSYLNWSEYLVWRNPRIASTMQYQLFDPPFGPSLFGEGGFATGLVSSTGKPKATFYAYRMPIWMPVTHTSSGSGLEVWGCARPAPYAYGDTHQPQYVRIQLQRGSIGLFRTVRTVRLAPKTGCYFDVRVKFPAGGTVRLAWSYPPGDARLADNQLTPRQSTIYSRPVPITIG
jgi:hypothetical protein